MKKFIFSTLIILGVLSVKAQLNLRHISGMRTYGLGATISNESFGTEFKFQQFFTKKIALEGNLYYEKGKIGFTDFTQTMVAFQLNYYPLELFKRLYLVGKTGIILGHEYKQSNVESKGKNNFAFYWNFGLRAQVYVSPHISIYLENQELLGKAGMGNYYNQSSLGLIVLTSIFTKKKNTLK